MMCRRKSHFVLIQGMGRRQHHALGRTLLSAAGHSPHTEQAGKSPGPKMLLSKRGGKKANTRRRVEETR